MIDIEFLVNNPEIVKENIKRKFQNEKLALVDEVLELYKTRREVVLNVEELKHARNTLSKQNSILFAQLKNAQSEQEKNDVNNQIEQNKATVKNNDDKITALDNQRSELDTKIREIMLVIPNIMDESVPIGKDDSENVEVQKYGDPVVPDFEVPYHLDIMEALDGVDIDTARRVSGAGFYYLKGDVARVHSAVLSYARDYMINEGFEYYIPPYLIRSNIVEGVMSFKEKDEMMYKIDGEDLYLIGTSEHSMIGAFIDTILDEKSLPQTRTSYSACFRKEKGSHGIEERGVYRVHQFEKQEMIVICKPEDSKKWFDKLWSITVNFFRSLDIPVRTLECCSGDLADLKVKSIDVEAWY